MEKFCLMSADALLSPSEYLACQIRATLRLPLEIACIPYPFVTHDKSVSPKAQPGHLVYVGRLEVRKGVLPLVEACSRLWSAGSDFRLTLIGGDVEFYPQDTTVGSIIRQQYKKWIESGRLTLVGQLEHAEVFRFMQQAWAVVIPSLWENFPHTCMEAMGSGQIILASRSGGQAEMIQNEGSEGFLFDWGIPGDFAQKLHRVLTLGEEERKKMGQCARARIQSLCAPEVILPQRLHHYETVIAHHQPRRFFPLPSGGVASWRAKFEERAGGGSAENEEIGLLSVVLLDGDPGLSVGETCKSLRAATYVPLEILFVQDEGAEEKSRARLREIEKCGISHPRVLRAKDANSEAARKTGIEMAKGQFITFIDLGDCVAPEFFERAIAVLQRYPNVAFVYSWVRSLGPSPSLWPTWNAEFPALLGRSMLSRLVVARKSALVNLRRDARQGEFDGENLEEWIALVAAGEAGVSLPHPLVSCRARPETLSLRARRNRQFHQYDLLTKRYADAYREWSGELLNLHNANGPAYLWNHYAAIESNEVSWRDYEIGGRLVSRLRKLWPVRQVLRSPMLKKVLRKLLES
jgi:glycosyltransferase involved in cell wall biosynthesis